MNNVFNQLRVMKIFDLYKYRLCSKYMVEKKQSQHYLEDLANLTKKVYVYPTRTVEPWEVPFFRTNYGQHTASYTLPSTLNKFSRENIELNNISVSSLRELIILISNQT